MTPAPRIERTRQAISTLCRHIPEKNSACLRSTLRRYPLHVLELLAAANVAIYILKDAERYDDASIHLRERKINVDGWPAPPAGLFVRAERTLYLRQTDPMVISHELNHAVDYALGNGQYRSETDPEFKTIYATARHFVTPYAACGIDEYFAEGSRAFLSINTSDSPWPRVSESSLRRRDPALYAYLDAIFTPPAADELAA